MTPNLLEGKVLDPRAQEMDSLRTENRRLRREADDARVEAERAREDANRALSMLRKQLGPLYRALQAVFGELDAAGVTEDRPHEPSSSTAPSAAAGVDSRVAAVWESWKQKLGPGTAAARVIDALLVHGEMNTPQLKVAGKMAGRTVGDAVYKLNQLGLINKNGGKFSLKVL